MSDQEYSKEEIILQQVKNVLTEVIKDTATPPGLKHPLKDDTIASMRECLVLISERQTELNSDAGREMNMRPRFIDEPKSRDNVVVPLDQTALNRKRSSDAGDE